MVGPFEVMGVARTFTFDAASLERRFFELSRALHPDRFAAGAAKRPEVLANSVARMSAVNEAYQALRNPAERRSCLLRVLGYDVYGENQPQCAPKRSVGGGTGQVPTEFAMRWFDLQDELETVQSPVERSRRLERFRADLCEHKARSDREVEELGRRWDAGPDHAKDPSHLVAMQKLLREANYLESMLVDLDRWGTR